MYVIIFFIAFFITLILHIYGKLIEIFYFICFSLTINDTADDCTQSIKPGTNSVCISNRPLISGDRTNKTSVSNITGAQRFDSRISSRASNPITTASPAVKVFPGSHTLSNRSEQSSPLKSSVLTSSTTKVVGLANSKKGSLMQAPAVTHSPVSTPVIVLRDNPDLDNLRIVSSTPETISHGLRSDRDIHKRKPSLEAGYGKGYRTENLSTNLRDRRSNSDVDLKLFSSIAASQKTRESDKGLQASTRDITANFARAHSIEQPAKSHNDDGMFVLPG